MYADLYTKLLLHCDGADGALSFLDSSQYDRIISTFGNIQIDTAQSKFGGASGLFDGTGDYLTIPDSDDFYLGSNDFTIDFWIRFNSVSSCYFCTQNAAGSNWTIAYDNGSNKLSIWGYPGSYSIDVNCSFTPSANMWYHLAFVRNGTGTNCILIFINGVSQTTTLANGAWNGSFPNIASVLYIGADTGGTPYFNGWLDEFHFSKGIARWTSNFTPDTSEYVDEYTINGIDSYTKLMLHCDGTNNSTSFRDSSDSNHTLTAFGNAKLSTAQSKFGGVSGLFDGTDDYLTIPDSSDFAFGADDFTIDFWIRLNAVGIWQTLYKHEEIGVNADILFRITDTNILNLMINWNGSSWAYNTSGTTVLSTGTWYHLAIVRNSTTIKLYINGTLELTHTVGTDSLYDVNASVYLGRDPNGGVYHLNGYLDEFRVSKGVARWTSNFNSPISMYRRENPDCYTKLLLHCNGIDTSQIFTDVSGNFSIAINQTQIDTAQSKFGGASGLFDGSDYLVITNSTDFNLSDKDFTIDFWVRFNSVSGFQLFLGRNLSSDREFSVYYDTNNLHFAGYWNSATQDQSFSWTPVTNTWYHVAIVRHKSDLKAFIDGSQIGSTYNISTYIIRDSSINLILGTNYPPEDSGTYFNGWMDEIRISKIARWITTFTPPTSEYILNEFLDISDTIYISDEWSVLTNPEELTLSELIYLYDEWFIEPNPQIQEISEEVFLDDLWEIERTGTIRTTFSTKLYTSLETIYKYATDLRVGLTFTTQKFTTKLYLKQLVDYIYSTDLRIRYTTYNNVTIRSLTDFIVKLDGIDLIDVDYTTLQVYLNLNIEPSRTTFTLGRRHDNLNQTLNGVSSIITNENKVEVYDGSIKLFTGYINEIRADSSRDVVHIVAEDIRRKLSRLSMELEYGGEWRSDENDPPNYTYIEKNISTAFTEVMSACGGYLSGYDSLPFSGTFVPEYIKSYQDYVSLIDNLIRQTANCNWYIDENEKLRFQKIELGTIKTLPLASLTSKRHPYDLILHDVVLNKISTNYAKSLQVKLGKQITQSWITREYNQWSDYWGTTLKSIQNSLPKEYTAFCFQSWGEFGHNPFYIGMNAEIPTYYYTPTFGGHWVLSAKIIFQWKRQDISVDLSDITVGSGEPKKTIYLTSYGKKSNNYYWTEKDRYDNTEVWLCQARDAYYDTTSFVTDLANFELNQNNKLLTTANISLLLDAYEYYGLAFSDLINLTNTISSTIYNNQNGFPLNIETIHIDCSKRIVNLNLTNFGKSWYAKSTNIMSNSVQPELHWRYKKMTTAYYDDPV